MTKKRLQSIFRITVSVILCISLLFPTVPVWAVSAVSEPYDSIPGLADKALYDTDGQEVIAGSGEVHQFTENGETKWYWIGEDVSAGSGSTVHDVHLYSSEDLYNWTREEDIFRGMSSKDQFETDDYFKELYGGLSDPEKDTAFACLSRLDFKHHPKVLYNEKYHQYVMWIRHISGDMAVATSESIKGPFKFVKFCKDTGVGYTSTYQESDGSAYIIFQGEGGLSLAKLTEDYLGLDGAPQIMNSSEGVLNMNAEVTIFRRDSRYYMIREGTGKYAVSDSLTGAWEVRSLQMYNEGEKTFQDVTGLSSTSCVFKVNTESGVVYINITEKWDFSQNKIRYIWLPIRFFWDGSIALSEKSNWTLEEAALDDPENPRDPVVYDSIPGLADEVLYDTEGREVRAYGGEVHQVKENGKTKWYWFGESVAGVFAGSVSTGRELRLYSSEDLYNWTREEDIFKGTTSRDRFETDDYFKDLYGELSGSEKDIVFDCLKDCPTVHPKVLYNETDNQYVMWVRQASNGKMCIATSDSIKGPFKFVKYCENVGTGFSGLYKERNGTAYIIYQGTNGPSLAKLADDYMSVTGAEQTLNFSGGTFMASEIGIFERRGRYYMVNTNTKQYAVSGSLTGTWRVRTLSLNSEEGELNEGVNVNPTSYVLPVNTESGMVYINITEKWDYSTRDNVRHVWLPIKFSEDGSMALRGLSNWKLDDPEIPENPVVYDSIPGLADKVLCDTEGWEVKACGGEVHRITENGETKWYWFGEDVPVYSPNGSSTLRSLHLYSSTDLYNWKREEDIFKGMTSKAQFETDIYFKSLYGNLSDSDKDIVFECLKDCPTAHPKVLYNETDHQYVMWVPHSSNGKMCIATSDSIKGPFKFVKYCENVGTGFSNLYKERNGTAYIIYQGTNGLSLAKLADDYMGIAGAEQTLNFNGGAFTTSETGIFEREGRYYMVNTSIRQYAVSDSLTGTWSVQTLSLNSEGEAWNEGINLNPTSYVLPVNTENGMVYINITEKWDYSTGDNVRYVWLPISFSEDGSMALRGLSNWKLDEIVDDPEIPEDPTTYDSIPGLADKALYDTEGREVRASGGEVHKFTENGETKWYWFGEDVQESAGSERPASALHLYSSTDLYNWTREEDIFKGMTSKEQFETDDYFKNLYGDLSNEEKDIVFECLKDCPTAQAKVLYNKADRQYVMWVPHPNGKICIATSDSIKGPFKFVKYCERIDRRLSFISLYKESDGKAYVVYQGVNGPSLARLTDNYMDISGAEQTINFGGSSASITMNVSIFKKDGKYYMTDVSTARHYAMSDSLTGTWSVHELQLYNEEENAFKDAFGLNPANCILPVNTESGMRYIYITDGWNSNAQDKRRYVWLPIRFSEDGSIAVEELSDWKLDGLVLDDPEPPTEEPYDSIPGLADKALYDTEGQEINACGGEVHRITEKGETKWYWFGEDIPDHTIDGSSTLRALHLYSSTDLYNWTREEDIFKGMTSKSQFVTDPYFKKLYGNLSDSQKDIVFECLKNCPTAHPKVLYNEKDHQYVMWVPHSSNGKMCIATSDSIKGPFKFVKYCENASVGFAAMYRESNGDVYIVYQGMAMGGLSMAKLTDDYMDINGEGQTINFSGGPSMNVEVGIFERDGKYYMVNAGAKQYAVADSLDGTWSVYMLQLYNEEEEELKPAADLNPTSCILPVNTESGMLYINIADKWDYTIRDKTRYVWLPIKFFEDGSIALSELSNWKLEPSDPDPVPDIEVAEVRLTETSKTLKVGETYQIKANVFPENAKDKTLTFVSNDSTVVFVTNAGIAEAKKAGTATVTVVSANGKTAQLHFTVEAEEGPGEENPPVEVEEVRLTETSKTLMVGETYQIEASVFPENAKDKTLTFMSSDNTVVSVSNTGEVEAKKAGTATVMVMSANGKTGKLQLKVEEEPSVEVEEVRLAETSKTLKIGETYQIEASVFPENADNKALTFTSSDHKVASVTITGEVEAKKAGTATVTVTSANGKTASLQLTVEEEEGPGKEEPPVEVEEVRLAETSKTLKVGDTYQIRASVFPENAKDKTLTFKSSDSTVASVTSAGVAKAKKAGKATVTVTSANGKTAKLQLTVEVKKIAVKKVLVSTTNITAGVGEKVQLEVAVYPSNATDTTLTYKSSNGNVAVNKKNGVITAKKTGTSKITITSSNNKKAVVKVTVKKKPGKISLKTNKKTLKVGKKFQIQPKLPKGTASYTISYASNKKSVATVSTTGKVTAKKKGDAVITVKTYNGKKATLRIHVK